MQMYKTKTNKDFKFTCWAAGVHRSTPTQSSKDDAVVKIELAFRHYCIRLKSDKMAYFENGKIFCFPTFLSFTSNSNQFIFFSSERQLTDKNISMDYNDDSRMVNHINTTDLKNTFVFKPLREEWIKTKPPILIEKKFC